MSDHLQLDAVETQTIARATDSAVTRRRIWYSMLLPVALIILLLAMFWSEAQPRLLLWLFVIYVAVTMLERVAYGFAVLAYKSAIRKLLARVAALESPPGGRAGGARQLNEP